MNLYSFCNFYFCYVSTATIDWPSTALLQLAANWWAANQALLTLCAAGSAGAASNCRAWHWLRLAMANANHILLSFPFFGNLRSHSSARGLFIFGQQIRQLISIVVANAHTYAHCNVARRILLHLRLYTKCC